MKYPSLLFLLFVCLFAPAQAPRNTYSFGYGKALGFFNSQSHVVAMQYDRKLSKHWSVGLRNEFQSYEFSFAHRFRYDPYSYVSHFDWYMIQADKRYIVPPGTVYDNISAGTKQLGTRDYSISNFSACALAGYEHRFWKDRMVVAATAGVGATYTRTQFLMTSIVITPTNNIPPVNGGLMLPIYGRGWDFSPVGGITLGYRLSPRFDVGLNTFFTGQASSIISNSITVRTHF